MKVHLQDAVHEQQRSAAQILRGGSPGSSPEAGPGSAPGNTGQYHPEPTSIGIPPAWYIRLGQQTAAVGSGHKGSQPQQLPMASTVPIHGL